MMKGQYKIWNKNEILRLIEVYRKNEVLWNTKIPQYKNRSLKQECLKNMALEFKTPVYEIQRKVHNLRCQLNSELKKLNRKREESCSNDMIKSTWEYFEPLLFVTATFNDNDFEGFDISSHVEAMLEATDDEVNVKEEPNDDFDESPKLYIDLKEDTLQINDNELLQDSSNKEFPLRRRSNLITNFKMSYPSPGWVQSKKVPVTKKSTVFRKKKITTPENGDRDDCQIFGDFVAAELRNLKNETNQRKLKRIIQKAILEISESED